MPTTRKGCVRMSLAPSLGIFAPCGERLHLSATDVLLFACRLNESIIVGQRVEFDVGFGEVTLGNLETVGEDCRHALYVATALTESFHCDEAALASGDKVFDNHYGLTFVDFAFNLVCEAVGLGFGAHVNKGFSQFLGNQGTLCYATGGDTGYHIYIAPVFVDHVDKTLTNECAYFGIGKCNTVVAINRRFATGSPCEGVLVVEFYCFDLQ